MNLKAQYDLETPLPVLKFWSRHPQAKSKHGSASHQWKTITLSPLPVIQAPSSSCAVPGTMGRKVSSSIGSKHIIEERNYHQSSEQQGFRVPPLQSRVGLNSFYQTKRYNEQIYSTSHTSLLTDRASIELCSAKVEFAWRISRVWISRIYKHHSVSRYEPVTEKVPRIAALQPARTRQINGSHAQGRFPRSGERARQWQWGF